MASPNETRPHAAIILAGRGRGPGNTADKFTDTELEVAENLVLLSESSSGGGMGIAGGSDEEGDVTVQQQQQHTGRRMTNGNICRSTSSSLSTSSSTSSVNTTRAMIGSSAVEDVDDGIDEELTGPLARLSQKYRSIDDVYSITRRIDAIEDHHHDQKTKKRKKKRASKYGNTDQ